MSFVMSEREDGQRSVAYEAGPLYFKEMGLFPTLTRDEERRHCQVIEINEGMLARLLLHYVPLFHDMIPDKNGGRPGKASRQDGRYCLTPRRVEVPRERDPGGHSKGSERKR